MHRGTITSDPEAHHFADCIGSLGVEKMKKMGIAFLTLLCIGANAWSQCPCLQRLLQDTSARESQLQGAVKTVKRLEFDWDAVNKRKVLNRIIESQFNARGQLVSERWISKDGKTLLQCRSNDYDAAGRLISSTFSDWKDGVPTEVFTRYKYLADSVRIVSKQGKGKGTLATYTSYVCRPGNLISSTTSSSLGTAKVVFTYVMDYDCHIVREEHRDSYGKVHLKSSEYDKEGKVICVKQFIEGRNKPTDIVRYTRDATGRVLQFFHYNYFGVIDNRVYHCYDNRGMLVKEVVVDSSEAKAVRLEKDYRYDSHGNWIEMKSYSCGRNAEDCPKKSLVSLIKRGIDYW